MHLTMHRFVECLAGGVDTLIDGFSRCLEQGLELFPAQRLHVVEHVAPGGEVRTQDVGLAGNRIRQASDGFLDALVGGVGVGVAGDQRHEGAGGGDGLRTREQPAIGDLELVEGVFAFKGRVDHRNDRQLGVLDGFKNWAGGIRTLHEEAVRGLAAGDGLDDLQGAAGVDDRVGSEVGVDGLQALESGERSGAFSAGCQRHVPGVGEHVAEGRGVGIAGDAGHDVQAFGAEVGWGAVGAEDEGEIVQLASGVAGDRLALQVLQDVVLADSEVGGGVGDNGCVFDGAEGGATPPIALHAGLGVEDVDHLRDVIVGVRAAFSGATPYEALGVGANRRGSESQADAEGCRGGNPKETCITVHDEFCPFETAPC